MKVHADLRRIFFADVFPVPVGSVNVVHIPAGAAPYTDRHRHQRQDDYFFAIHGQLRFTLSDATGSREVLLDGDGGARLLHVPAGVWHHYAAGPEGASYVMWATQKYDGTDEERAPR